MRTRAIRMLTMQQEHAAGMDAQIATINQAVQQQQQQCAALVRLASLRAMGE